MCYCCVYQKRRVHRKDTTPMKSKTQLHKELTSVSIQNQIKILRQWVIGFSTLYGVQLSYFYHVSLRLT